MVNSDHLYLFSISFFASFDARVIFAEFISLKFNRYFDYVVSILLYLVWDAFDILNYTYSYCPSRNTNIDYVGLITHKSSFVPIPKIILIQQGSMALYVTSNYIPDPIDPARYFLGNESQDIFCSILYAPEDIVMRSPGNFQFSFFFS